MFSKREYFFVFILNFRKNFLCAQIPSIYFRPLGGWLSRSGSLPNSLAFLCPEFQVFCFYFKFSVSFFYVHKSFQFISGVSRPSCRRCLPGRLAAGFRAAVRCAQRAQECQRANRAGKLIKSLSSRRCQKFFLYFF